MAKESYKEKWISKLNKHILQHDRTANNWTTISSADRWMAAHKADNLRVLRTKAETLHGNHFIPKRFPTHDFAFLQMTFDSLK